MLKSLLGILVALVVCAVVGITAVNLYNKNKLKDNDFKKTTENDKVIDENKSESKNNDSVENDDSYVSTAVNVESTSSYKNGFITIIGGITFVIGLGTVLYNKN